MDSQWSKRFEKLKYLKVGDKIRTYKAKNIGIIKKISECTKNKDPLHYLCCRYCPGRISTMPYIFTYGCPGLIDEPYYDIDFDFLLNDKITSLFEEILGEI